MAGKTITTPNGSAPGPDVVEALASPMFARFTEAALTEAAEALHARYVSVAERLDNGTGLTPTQVMTLDAIRSLGAQLVTATTPVGAPS